MAAVTIYWYGPERPASRQCLARCAALYAGQLARHTLNRGRAGRAVHTLYQIGFPDHIGTS